MRPPRVDNAQTAPYTLRLTPEERERLKKAASANRQQPSDFARDAIVTAAGDVLEEASGSS
jgi:uncharacterized protein (DUF1778 family)